MQSVILYSLEKNRKTVKECSYLTEKPSHSFYWSILSKELQNQSRIGRLRETIFFRYGSKSYSRHVNFWKKDVFVLSRACNKEKSLSPYAESDYRFLLRPTVLCLTLNPTYALWKKTKLTACLRIIMYEKGSCSKIEKLSVTLTANSLLSAFCTLKQKKLTKVSWNKIVKEKKLFWMLLFFLTFWCDW